MKNISKKIFVMFLFLNFLILTCNVNAVDISKTKDDQENLTIDINHKCEPSKQTHKLKINDLEIEYESYLKFESYSSNTDDFNPFYSDLLAWYLPLQILPGIKIDVLCYRLIIENNGGDYNFGSRNITLKFDFYIIGDDGSEVLLNESKVEFYDFYNENFVWNFQEYIVWIGFLFPEEKVNNIKGSFEIVDPKNVPDSNLEDNIIFSPVTEPVQVDANVKNLNGYAIHEAIVVGYSGTRDNLSAVVKTNKKGEATLYIAPRYPLIESAEYEVLCYIDEEEQSELTEPVFPGGMASVAFEFDIKARFITRYLIFSGLKSFKKLFLS